jgi:hypothetical protein
VYLKNLPVSSHSLNLAAGQGHLKNKTKIIPEFNSSILPIMKETGDTARLPAQIAGRRGTNEVKKCAGRKITFFTGQT